MTTLSSADGSMTLNPHDTKLLITALSKCCDNPEGLKINYKKLHAEFPHYTTAGIAGKAWLRVWRKLIAAGTEGTSTEGGVRKRSSAAGNNSKNKKRGRKDVGGVEEEDDDDEGMPAAKVAKKGGKKEAGSKVKVEGSGDEEMGEGEEEVENAV